MKKILLLTTLIITFFFSIAQNADEQNDSATKKIYRATPTKINDLVHTKIECKFDYSKSWMYGKVWITLQPHFYKTDSLTLDAQGMAINEVAMVNGNTNSKLQYTYNQKQIKIKLGKQYKMGEKYTVYIDYISKPNDLKTTGSVAITDEKGLYFINPLGEIKNKPIQIWTQGETESTSAWVPTIDEPSQKCTDEIYMTVPSKYVTLSNGLKISEKQNADGTRTDYWKMDLPHSPYLFFMGVGDFAIVKDKPYNGKEVSYYVEKDQEKYAKGVFGNTPEMIKFFSEKLGVEYPWQKYSQIVGRDYVSGAMENTTATLHMEAAYQNDRELADGNSWEGTIAHELFHQWFGDLVTAESWSNITLNESFADYSEYLWDEYKYGKDKADETHSKAIQEYLFSNSEKKDLVRYNYNNEMEVFDGVSYAKGGRILHMLRKYVGDDAFFASLKNYLTTNKFKNGEAAQLRLAFEEVTGEDLNWFWNQWYYNSGHPKLNIITNYEPTTGKEMVVIAQTQSSKKSFQLPIDLDIYTNGQKTRYRVWTTSLADTFYFNSKTKPDLVDVDGDRVLLMERKENKTDAEYVFQFNKNTNYLAKKEAINYFAKNKMKELALGLKDNFAGLRNYTLDKINALNDKKDFISQVQNLALTEKDNKTKAAAIKILAKEKNAAYESIFKSNIDAVSYKVAGASLDGLAALNPTDAYTLAKKYSTGAKGPLNNAVNKIIFEKGSESDFDYLNNLVSNGSVNQSAFNNISGYAKYLANIKNMVLVKKGIDGIKTFRSKIPAAFLGQVDGTLKQFLKPISDAHGSEIETYIENIFK